MNFLKDVWFGFKACFIVAAFIAMALTLYLKTPVLLGWLVMGSVMIAFFWMIGAMARP